MKKKPGLIVCAILNFISGICFLIAAMIHKEQGFSAEVPQYAAACFLIAGAGFLYIHFKRKSNKVD